MDKETHPRPDVKVMQRPGGNSSFKLGWDDETPKQQKQVQKKEEIKETEVKKVETKKEQDMDQKGEYQKLKDVKTSVKLHAPPGGKSNFTLG